ncbi:glutamate--cysteine ligase [Nocardioides conyzicola]|uniref:Putative glutamate--cysteine ligase 2 n=1 Tax=Nocardioides conyzicola TaxID=1651781 RepID=A0ABP8XSM1_9ACTN
MAGELIAAFGPGPGGAVEVKHEFFSSQVEVTSSPHTALSAIRDELQAARTRLAHVGAAYGVAPLAVPGPVLAGDGSGPDLSPGDRYAAIEQHYGDVARRSLMCALHVHVDVTDDEEGVAVIDRVRPWIPVLLAISANSPYWHGHDSGYESWRSRQWNMWPTSGPAEPFGSAAAYQKVVGEMVSRGAALDVGMVNLDVRLSHRYPTVEFRAPDVCTDLDDAMLVAALARALVTHLADQWRDGMPAEEWRVDELRAAAWRASRFGLRGTLVSPLTRDLTGAGHLLRQMADLLAEPLAATGDASSVARGLAALVERGHGASRQRQALASPRAQMMDIVADLRMRTVATS